jgi:AraC-like DNA-binding protein
MASITDEAGRLALVGMGVEPGFSDVAARWGFLHLGRFASVHRATYGMTPSQAVAR